MSHFPRSKSPTLSMEPRRGATPTKEDIEWVPLHTHPIFSSRNRNRSRSSSLPASAASATATGSDTNDEASTAKIKNLSAWHSASSRLYLWDPDSRCVHRLALRFSSAAVEAAFPSEKLVPDAGRQMDVNYISLNEDGSLLFLAGSDALSVVKLQDRTRSNPETLVCRTSLVGSRVYFGQSNGLQILQAAWHPFSSTHLGILSSDSVFRLFDLSSDVEQPEQEYYLQAVEAGKCDSAVSICPVAFSFGAHHLWERFSVFVLFSDGSVYVLCPIVPFGSFHSLACLDEIYKDINLFGLKSSNTKAAGYSSLAISWLEATFPELSARSVEGGNALVSKAQPYALLDASLSLQGPLANVSHGVEDNSKVSNLASVAKAVGFLYSSVGKDSVFVIAWSNGQIQIDALADEVQPFWNADGSPHLRVNSHGNIIAIAMICESSMRDSSVVDLRQWVNQGKCVTDTADAFSLGHPPPLLRLALVDLALPKYAFDSCLPSLFSDPLLSDTFYCLHGGGVDLITLNFLPFSNLTPEVDKVAKAPSVYPILTTYLTKPSTPVLWGFVIIDDSIGLSQIVGITSSNECVMLEKKPFDDVLPLHFNVDSNSIGLPETTSRGILSKELLSGSKAILIPSSLRSVVADSIEGRSTLHHYIKVLHENYVEYAHKVYIELKEHGDHVKAILNDQYKRLNEAKQKLSSFESKEAGINDRIHHAFEVYGLLEQRLERFKKLPGFKKKPLTKAELEFEAQLDRFAELELDALQSSIDSLNARLKRFVQSQPVSPTATRRTTGRGMSHALDSQISHLRSSLERLSVINNENTEKSSSSNMEGYVYHFEWANAGAWLPVF